MFTPFVFAFLLFAFFFGGALLVVSWLVREPHDAERGPSSVAVGLSLVPAGPHEARGQLEDASVRILWASERRGQGGASRVVQVMRYVVVDARSDALALGPDDALGTLVGVTGAIVTLGMAEVDTLAPRGAADAWRERLSRPELRGALAEATRAGRIAVGAEGVALEREGWDGTEDELRRGLMRVRRLAAALGR